MTERLLQFIWQFQYFNKKDLLLEDPASQRFAILDQGKFNTHQGPDFLEAKISIGKTTWVGHVEVHIKTSDWDRHQHNDDPNYENVILHVVWKHDVRKSINKIPVFSLEDRIPGVLLSQYNDWMQSMSFIPCENQIGMIPELSLRSWYERLLIERLLRKSVAAHGWLQESGMNWEEIFWWMIARNFGMTVNAEAFESMARSLPFKILTRHRKNLHQIEALLFGQAGLLGNRHKETYPKMLYTEHRFYKKKYKLQAAHVSVNLLRMRPGNFPTVRLAQLAMLLYESENLFSAVRESSTIAQLRKLINVTASEYWHHHYLFDEETNYQPKKLGAQMADNIIINTLAPVIFAYGLYHQEEHYKEKAINWLTTLNAEKNNVISGFAKCGIVPSSAADSQGLLELKSKYCDERRCLDCTIGNTLLRRIQK